MRFLIDADLPPDVADALQAAGHVCEYVPDLFAPRTPDPLIAAHARVVGACIITRDFGFSDMRRYVPREHFGIIVLTVPSHRGTTYILGLISELLGRFDELAPLTGKLMIVEPNRIRIRE